MGGPSDRSSSVIKMTRNQMKTEHTENSMIGATTEKSKKPGSFAINQKLMTPRGNQSEVSGINMRS